MVYDPETMTRLGLSKALYLAVFPRTVAAVGYAFYGPGERGAFGVWVNRVLDALIILIRLLNVLLVPLLFVAIVAGLIYVFVLSIPWFAYRRVFGGPDYQLPRLADRFDIRKPYPFQSHSYPAYVRVISFPAQTIVWLTATPVKLVQIVTVLVAFSLGPKAP